VTGERGRVRGRLTWRPHLRWVPSVLLVVIALVAGFLASVSADTTWTSIWIGVISTATASALVDASAVWERHRQFAPVRRLAARRVGRLHQLLLQMVMVVFDDVNVSSPAEWPAALLAIPDGPVDLCMPLGGDGAEVARAARDTGGLLAAIAEHAPPADRRRLAAASAHLARAGQVEHGQARGARSPLSPGFAQVAVTVLTAASGGTASTAVLLAQVARLTRTVAELHAVQSRVAAARDTARAADLLSSYTTPTAPTPDPAPPKPVLMPNQEQLDAMLGSTRAQRFAAETRNRTRGAEPGTYRPPPPSPEPGRER